jgi:trk system potassium uptake protein TrkH
MIDLRPLLLVIGILLTTLGTSMFLPALFDIAAGDDGWVVFAASGGVTIFTGVALTFSNWGRTTGLSVKQAFLLTTVSWLVLTAFAALPFAWSSIELSYTDAFFEAMSGITTTGSTVIDGLDTLSPGILLWRGLLQWLGGLGIIVMALSVLPMLKVGGMQLFRTEGFDTAGKILPRATQIAGELSILYIFLTAACALSYRMAGMSAFDALVHAMTTIATGGYANYDASFAHFNSAPIKLIGIIFMVLGSLPFVLYLQMVRGDIFVVARDTQVRWFLGTAGVFTLVGVASYSLMVMRPGDASVLDAAFNVVSIMSGTGYSTGNFDSWGPLAVALFFTLMFIGGCSGSTSCGIKIFRFQVLFQGLRQKLRLMFHPHGIFLETYNGRPLSGEVISAVMAFFFLYMASFMVTALALGLTGLDHLTAISSAATAISNVGPGLGDKVGPAGHFAAIPDSAKWIMSAAMLLGRLELFAVLVLFLPAFWRS